MPTRARASTRDWGTLIFNYGRREVRNFLLVQRPLLAGQVPHRRPARRCRGLDALSRLQPRSKGEWMPNEFGGRENLEAIDFLKRLNELRLRPAPRA